MERLYSSALVVLVDQRSPRRLRVFHSKRNSEICCYGYCNAILKIKLNRDVSRAISPAFGTLTFIKTISSLVGSGRVLGRESFPAPLVRHESAAHDSRHSTQSQRRLCAKLSTTQSTRHVLSLSRQHSGRRSADIRLQKFGNH